MTPAPKTDDSKQDNTSEDERLLAALGYKQELKRTWSSFSNFAISFSIISILSGCFTTFGQAWVFALHSWHLLIQLQAEFIGGLQNLAEQRPDFLRVG